VKKLSLIPAVQNIQGECDSKRVALSFFEVICFQVALLHMLS